MTKREMYNEILNVEAVAANEEMVEFINNEIALIDKRNANKKPTAKQKENADYKVKILAFLAEQDEPVRIAAIMKGIDLEQNQRVARLVTDLVKEGKVTRTEIKRAAYFEIATE